MSKENRVLAYEKATELEDCDLVSVSGGSIKGSVGHEGRFTGYPTPSDFEVVQVYD